MGTSDRPSLPASTGTRRVQTSPGASGAGVGTDDSARIKSPWRRRPAPWIRRQADWLGGGRLRGEPMTDREPIDREFLLKQLRELLPGPVREETQLDGTLVMIGGDPG